MSGPERKKRFVLAMTGASGAPYAVRLLQVLARCDVELHVTVSPSGAAVIRQELGLKIDPRRLDVQALLQCRPPWSRSPSSRPEAKGGPSHDRDTTIATIAAHQYDDYMTPIASGSFQTDAMVICPCSGSTLSGIARAAASNLIQRAAEVHLKEHRRLILVPRETPMSVLQLENLHRVAQAGAVVLPAMPGWYHEVETLDDLVDFIVSRILDQLELDNSLIHRWGAST